MGFHLCERGALREVAALVTLVELLMYLCNVLLYCTLLQRPMSLAKLSGIELA